MRDVFIWWGVFLCWIFYVPLRCCYLLRSALCIRFKHCVQLDLYPELPYIYSDIEKYIVISYLLIFHIMKENEMCRINWECEIEYILLKQNKFICTWYMCVSAAYLFNNYFDSSIRTRNRTRPPGLRVQNTYNGFILFIYLPGRKLTIFLLLLCAAEYSVREHNSHERL